MTAHSDKEHAEPTFKRGYGFHPMCSSIDHGAHGTGDVGVVNLRPGRASAWDGAAHIACLDDTLASSPRTNGRRCWSAPIPTAAPRRSCVTSPTWGSEYSIEFPGNEIVRTAIEQIPSRHGGLRSMVTASHAMARRSPSEMWQLQR